MNMPLSIFRPGAPQNPIVYKIPGVDYKNYVEIEEERDPTAKIAARAIVRSGLSDERIAEDANLCVATVVNLKMGYTRRPRSLTIVKVMAALGYKTVYSHPDGTEYTL